MPIQPLNNQSNYQSISREDEDVEPVDRTIAKQSKRSFRYVIAACILIIVVAASVVAWFKYKGSRPVSVYQTSLEQTNMRQVNNQDIAQLGDNQLNSLTFGNTNCEYDEPNAEYMCFNMDSPPAMVIIKDMEAFQEVVGFGGAFTEASAVNFYKLPPRVQDKVIELYFGEDGIGLSLGRVHINSCDFSIESYNFDNIPDDFELKYFDTEVTHDQTNLLPFIKRAMEASPRPIKLMASPWSPPAWMKVADSAGNTSMLGSALPNGLIDTPQVKYAWARYISKWVTAYGKQGVPVWSVTPQNEPEFPAPWEACAYTADYERDFITHYLGPVLGAEHPDVLILGFDHNKDHLLAWTETLMNLDNSKHVDGMAFHWYSGGARVEDGTYGYDAVNASHHLAPEAVLIASEGCSCPGVEIGNWLRAERLGHDVMYDLLNHAQGWIDWNLLVNYEGGPNHLNNLCDASIVTNEDFSDVIVQPKFHYLAHFSKFIAPGARRIASTAVGNFDFAPVDPNIQAGVEVGMFSCERSVRQTWSLVAPQKASDDYITDTPNNRAPDPITTTGATDGDVETNPANAGRVLQLASSALTMDQSFDGTVKLCVAHSARMPRTALRLADCMDPDASFPLLALSPLGQIVDTESGLCLSFIGDVREPGALLELATCVTTSAADTTEPASGHGHKKSIQLAADHQLFALSPSTGEITAPKVDRTLCLTAGWPFLSAVAFTSRIAQRAVDPSGEGTSDDSASTTTVVVMNEAAVSSPLVLWGKEGYLGLSIAARAIQTIVF